MLIGVDQWTMLMTVPTNWSILGVLLGSLLVFAFHRVGTAALTGQRGAGVEGRGPWGADGRCRHPGRDITALKNVFQYG